MMFTTKTYSDIGLASDDIALATLCTALIIDVLIVLIPDELRGLCSRTKINQRACT